MNPIISRGPGASSRLDSSSGCPVAFERVTLGSISNEPHRAQISVDPPGALRPLRRWIGTGTVSPACRPPCPASGCYAWHAALFLDVCRRDGPRYCGDHVSGRIQSYSTRHAPSVCAALSRGLPDFSQPRPSIFLSVIFVAHRLIAEPHPSPMQSIEWVVGGSGLGTILHREKGPASSW